MLERPFTPEKTQGLQRPRSEAHPGRVRRMWVLMLSTQAEAPSRIGSN